MRDWSKCPAEERIPGRSAVPGFSPIPGCPYPPCSRTWRPAPPLKSSWEWFAPVDEWKVRAVLQYVADSLKAPVPVSSLENPV